MAKRKQHSWYQLVYERRNESTVEQPVIAIMAKIVVMLRIRRVAAKPLPGSWSPNCISSGKSIEPPAKNAAAVEKAFRVRRGRLLTSNESHCSPGQLLIAQT